jgi:hypothetical protein
LKVMGYQDAEAQVAHSKSWNVTRNYFFQIISPVGFSALCISST